jgi:putative PIN family toxin of toxin-antitoxin system
MRVFLDTNVLVRATKTATGPARELLRCFERPEHVLVLSKWVVDEVRRVLRYPRVAAIHRLDEKEVDEFLNGLEQIADMVQLQEKDDPQAVVSDAEDVPILQTAVLGRAEVLCTRDRHLYEPSALEYCRQHGVEVMDDVDLLSRLREQGTEIE